MPPPTRSAKLTVICVKHYHNLDSFHSNEGELSIHLYVVDTQLPVHYNMYLLENIRRCVVLPRV